jgi:hypothetical protein
MVHVDELRQGGVPPTQCLPPHEQVSSLAPQRAALLPVTLSPRKKGGVLPTQYYAVPPLVIAPTPSPHSRGRVGGLVQLLNYSSWKLEPRHGRRKTKDGLQFQAPPPPHSVFESSSFETPGSRNCPRSSRLRAAARAVVCVCGLRLVPRA